MSKHHFAGGDEAGSGDLPNDGTVLQSRRPDHSNDDIAVDWFAVREAILAVHNAQPAYRFAAALVHSEIK